MVKVSAILTHFTITFKGVLILKEILNFTFDDIYSEDMGVIQVKASDGLFEESFGATRQINEQIVIGRDKPYFFNVENDPLEFDLVLYFEDMDNDKCREISRWLYSPNYYKPLVFEGHEDRIFYCMAVGSPLMIHNGLNQGYLEITMRCDSPYAYSPVYLTEVYDLSINGTDGTEIKIENYGDIDCKPFIYLEKVNDGDLSIVNFSNAGQTLHLYDVWDGDFLIIDCENKSIETEVSGVFDYATFNNTFVNLTYGVNRLQVYGDCKIQFKYQFNMLV